RLPREELQHREDLGRELPVGRGGERPDVGVQLLPAGQSPLPQEIDDLLERGVGHEIVDVEAAIEQAALVTVDEADFRGGNDDVLETGLERMDLGGGGAVRHGSPALLPGGCNENVTLYHTPGATSRLSHDRGSPDRPRLLRPPPDQRGADPGRPWTPRQGPAGPGPRGPVRVAPGPLRWPRRGGGPRPARRDRARRLGARRLRRSRGARSLPRPAIRLPRHRPR